MTQDTLYKAKTLQAEIIGCKADLDNVRDFIDRIPVISRCGLTINNGMNFESYIVPREEEINAMLLTMRKRLENRIAELEKEFAEL